MYFYPESIDRNGNAAEVTMLRKGETVSRNIFEKQSTRRSWSSPVYVGMFAELLENSRLKPVIYDHIIDYYRFRGLNPEDMYEGAAKLYRVLDEKRGMKKKKTGTLQTVILVGAVAGVRAGTRSVSSGSGAGAVWLSGCAGNCDRIDVSAVSPAV
ncbi:MAG: hypothetical protein ACLU3F_00290 [Blautia wexlerae]